MTPTLLQYNVVIYIVLFIGMTLIHNSSQIGGDERIQKNKLNFYYTPGSPPCRSVLLTAKALGLEFNLILMDLFESDHMKPGFVKYLWIFGYAQKTDEKEKRLHDALGFLETFLESSDWAAGNSMTLADISLVATISTFEVSGVDLSRHEKVSKWLLRCKTTMVGYEDINQFGADRFKALITKKLANTVPQSELVTKDDVFKAIKVLRKAVTAKFIGEEFSDSINKISTAVSVY